MRKHVMAVVVAALALAGGALADEAHSLPKVNSLIDQNAYWAYWLKPQAALTELDGEVAGTGGGALGLSLARTFYVGLGYYGLLGSVDLADDTVSIGSFDLWYTGLDLGYSIAPEQLVHGALSVLIGGGSAEASYAGGGKDDGGIFVVEPQASLLINVATDIELGLGAGYRYVNGGPDGVDDSDLSGLAGSIFFRYTERR